MNPCAPAARAALADSRPAPEYNNARVDGEAARIMPDDLGPGLLADEQVDQRDVRRVAAGELDGLLARRRRDAALDPVEPAEHQAQPPVDDLVVVDDEDAEVAFGHAVSGRGRTRRTCQCSGPVGPKVSDAPCWRASKAEMRSPIPAPPRCAGPTPSLVISSSTVSASPRTATSMRAGAAWRRALRIASPRIDWVTGSKIAGIVMSRCQSTVISGALAASRSSSSWSVSTVCRGVAASGRAIASRRSSSAAPSSAAARLLIGLVEQRAGLQRHDDAEDALDDALVDLARQVDAIGEMAAVGLLARGLARRQRQRANLAQRAQDLALLVGQLPLGPLGEDHAEAVATRGERDADEVLDLHQRVVGRRQLVGAALEHLVEVERAAGDRRRLDREVVAVEELDVDLVGADDPHAAGDVVVDEDDGAPHRPEAADGLGEAVVEGSGCVG